MTLRWATTLRTARPTAVAPSTTATCSSGLVGVLSTNNNSYAPAYPTTTGWDFASGLGSVNAFNLVMAY